MGVENIFYQADSGIGSIAFIIISVIIFIVKQVNKGNDDKKPTVNPPVTANSGDNLESLWDLFDSSESEPEYEPQVERRVETPPIPASSGRYDPDLLKRTIEKNRKKRESNPLGVDSIAVKSLKYKFNQGDLKRAVVYSEILNRKY